MREFRFTLRQGLFKARSGALTYVISLKHLVYSKTLCKPERWLPSTLLLLLPHPLKVHLPF